MVESRGAIYVGVPGDEQYGSITCAVEVKHPSGRDLYAMSCQHVLSATLDPRAEEIRSGVRVSPVMSARPQVRVRHVASSSEYGGRVRADGKPSFDVQLARVMDREWLKGALTTLRLSESQPFIPDRSTLEYIGARNGFEILVPQNHPKYIATQRSSLAANFRVCKSETLAISYTFSGASISVRHWLLGELRVLGGVTTEPGDSGSAVIARDADNACVLVGMHIAGDVRTGLAYFIPAFQLFKPINYWNLPFGASMKPVNP